MATFIQRYWRTRNNNYKYVDSEWGDDVKGNGTQLHPFKTLEHAYQTLPNNTSAYTIVFRGYQRLTATILDNHATTIMADYPGAGIVDGAAYNEVTQQYEPTHSLIWCAAYTNLTLWNMGVGAGQFIYRQESTYTSYGQYASLSGAGRAVGAGNVGNAPNVSGFASSPVRAYNCALWRGGIGGTNTVGNVYASVRPCSGSLATLNQAATSCTMYDGRLNVNITGSTANATTNPTLQKCLFAKWDIFIGVKTQSFTECFFAADCNFYYFASNTYYKIVLGDTSASSITCTLNAGTLTCTVDGVTNIKDACLAVISNYSVTNTTFTNCTWGTQTSAQLFVDADNYNLALKDGCEAVLGDKGYFGAIAPAKLIRFLQNSDGQLWAFDHRTIDGDCLAINQDGELCVNLNSTDDGAIFSKIIQINPAELQFDGIEALVQTKKNREGFVLSRRQYFLGDFVDKLTNLAVGTYIVVGEHAVTYGTHTVIVDGQEVQEEILYQPMDVFEVEEGDANKQYDSEGTTKLVRELIDPNQIDGLYIRCRSMIYKWVTPQSTLVEGATYLNTGSDNITYAGRTVVPGESFVCTQGATSFSHATDNNYKVGVVFDDPDLPATEWIFYSLQGRAFVSKSQGSITRSTNGMPESSGNPKAWDTATSLNIQGTATNINQPYVQVAIFVTNLKNVNE